MRKTVKNKSKGCESQSRSPSLRFTGKFEQNFSLESMRKDGMTSSCCSWRNARHSSKNRRNERWLNAMHSGD